MESPVDLVDGKTVHCPECGGQGYRNSLNDSFMCMKGHRFGQPQQYAEVLVKEVLRRKDSGETIEQVMRDIVGDSRWITCVPSGTWADTQSEAETAKRDLETAVRNIYGSSLEEEWAALEKRLEGAVADFDAPDEKLLAVGTRSYSLRELLTAVKNREPYAKKLALRLAKLSGVK